MDTRLINTLEQDLRHLYTGAAQRGQYPGVPAANGTPVRTFAARTAELADALAGAPYSPARELARDRAMDLDEIKLAFKLIQRSDAAKQKLRTSPNGDYLNIVSHYFNHAMYVVVFFVGLSCPGRCIFCPNVTVGENGTRRLSLYQGKKGDTLSPAAIEKVFADVSDMKDQGTFVLIKISGGLEPLTDPSTMALILDRARERDIRVKLFTNGLLLDTEKRRHLALGAEDVRISLSVFDEEAFSHVMFGRDKERKAKFGLPSLLGNLRRLVRERERLSPKTRIGLNTVVLEENHRELDGFVSLARDLGVDYIDFKPNYFTPYRPGTQARIAETVSRLKDRPEGVGPDLYFAGSLSSENLFWTHRAGHCRPHKQGRFKLFITPFGQCSPVHHGAFPPPGGIPDTRYSAGRIGPDRSLADILRQMPALPDLAYKKLNPFEHMLALEIEREEDDRAWGIPKSYDPYYRPAALELPPDLSANTALNRMFSAC